MHAMTKRPRILMALMFFILWAAVPLDAQPSPLLREREIMEVVAALIQKGHYPERSLDDTISERAFQSYLDSLDPLKLYFQQADIDAFAASRDELDDMMKEGQPRYAHRVFARFVERVKERVKSVEELLQESLDFTKDEVFITDPDAAHYARSPAEARDRWRRRLKYDLLSLEVEKVTGKEARERLLKRYRGYLKRMQEFSKEDVLELFINAVTTSFDPHSTWFSPGTFDNFTIETHLNYQGIGAHLREKDGYVVVAKLVPGGAAERAGQLASGDKIASVGQGDHGPMKDIVGVRVKDVVKLIRGPAGTVVRLGVLPAKGGGMKIYRIERARTRLEEGRAKGRVIAHGRVSQSAAFKVGVIDLPGFYSDREEEAGHAPLHTATEDIRRILEDFKKKQVGAVILDLRRNGGGLLSEAVGVTGLFIDRGPVVMALGSRHRLRRYVDHNKGRAWDGPLIVLTSHFSASASEIVAGAIKDYRRGLIVGDPTTHGKGTVQTVLDLADYIPDRGSRPKLGALKLTVRQFYRPGGKSTQLKGVSSDISLPAISGAMKVGEASLDYALNYDAIPPAAFKTEGFLDADLIKKLDAASLARRKVSKAFARLRREIDIYRRVRAEKSVPVNDKKFLALQASLEASKKSDKPTSDSGAKDQKEDKQPYFLEVLDIAHDYARLLASRRV